MHLKFVALDTLQHLGSGISTKHCVVLFAMEKQEQGVTGSVMMCYMKTNRSLLCFQTNFVCLGFFKQRLNTN